MGSEKHVVVPGKPGVCPRGQVTTEAESHKYIVTAPKQQCENCSSTACPRPPPPHCTGEKTEAWGGALTYPMSRGQGAWDPACSPISLPVQLAPLGALREAGTEWREGQGGGSAQRARGGPCLEKRLRELGPGSSRSPRAAFC